MLILDDKRWVGTAVYPARNLSATLVRRPKHFDINLHVEFACRRLFLNKQTKKIGALLF